MCSICKTKFRDLKKVIFVLFNVINILLSVLINNVQTAAIVSSFS